MASSLPQLGVRLSSSRRLWATAVMSCSAFTCAVNRGKPCARRPGTAAFSWTMIAPSTNSWSMKLFFVFVAR
jgi:hypothetical protein